MKILDGVVLAAEIVAGIAAVAFVVLLFTNDPSSGSAAGGPYGTDDGAAIYADSCAQCHGADGSGGIGPPLGGGAVVEAFPDTEAEIAVVVVEDAADDGAVAGAIAAHREVYAHKSPMNAEKIERTWAAFETLDDLRVDRLAIPD